MRLIGINYFTKMIYEPAEDSIFFLEFLSQYLSNQKNKDLIFLDMGTGSGILAETASKFLPKENILAVDINQESEKICKQKNIKFIQSNLFEKITGKFDLIVFNAPYLPIDDKEDKESQLTTTGGKRGDEIPLEFLKQAKEHLNNGGKIFLLVSSLTLMKKLKESDGKIVARKKIFFEELIIFEFGN